MIKPDTCKLKERERRNWSLAAEGWRRRDGLLRKGESGDSLGESGDSLPFVDI